MNRQQIGRCGELLVQYKLLLLGVESAPMTTDAGIDLIAFAAGKTKVQTIQVKTNAKPKPGGGKGRLALDWWISDECPADLAALADLSTSRVWLFRMRELASLAQQHPAGRHHFYMYVDPRTTVRSGQRAHAWEFDRYLLEHRAPSLFGV